MSRLNLALKELGRHDFPDPVAIDPDGVGIVAVGGDLAAGTLLSAYAQGLFPWFNEDEPIAWWCPEPRCVMVPTDYQPSRSLRKQAKKERCTAVDLKSGFDDVIHACSLPRSNGLAEGGHTWIHDEMIEAYTELHARGFAHSIEVWDGQRQLIGGLIWFKNWQHLILANPCFISAPRMPQSWRFGDSLVYVSRAT